MRDPDRIDVICATLNKYWHKVPDWRFLQLISNLDFGEYKGDLFFLEDDKFLKALEVTFEKFGGK